MLQLMLLGLLLLLLLLLLNECTFSVKQSSKTKFFFGSVEGIVQIVRWIALGQCVVVDQVWPKIIINSLTVTEHLSANI